MERPVKDILIIKPSSLGDILHVFPALALLHQKYPGAKFDYIVNPGFAELLDYAPCKIERRIMFDRKRLGSPFTLLPEFWRLIQKIRRKKYDLVIDFQGLFRSSILGFFARGGRKIGFEAPREKISKLFYTDTFNVPAGHALERNVALVNALLEEQHPVPESMLPDNPKVKSQLVSKLKFDTSRVVAVIPGARWRSKRFSTTLFADVMRHISMANPQVHFVFVGVRGDQVYTKRILKKLTGGFPVTDLTGKTTLGEMIELLRLSRAVISNDSGPLHAAAALGVKIFSFFGPTDPAKTGPYGNDTTVYQANLDCIKCLKRKCNVKGKLKCHSLDAAVIAQEVVGFLSNQKSAPAAD